MSPREHYERAVASMRAEGLAVEEHDARHNGGKLHYVHITRLNISNEETHALLATALRAGARFEHIVYAGGTQATIAVSWTEPPTAPCESCGRGAA